MSRAGAKTITLSFKSTEKDKKLYDYLNSLEDKSVEIKRLIRLALEKEGKEIC